MSPKLLMPVKCSRQIFSNFERLYLLVQEITRIKGALTFTFCKVAENGEKAKIMDVMMSVCSFALSVSNTKLVTS